jgi:hypothetical protein
MLSFRNLEIVDHDHDHEQHEHDEHTHDDGPNKKSLTGIDTSS